MTQNPIQELLSRLTNQLDVLPKLRDVLTEAVTMLNDVLDDEPAPEQETRKPQSVVRAAQRARKAQPLHFQRAKKKKRKKAGPRRGSKGKYLDEMPANAMKVPTISGAYSFCPGLGLVSTIRRGTIRLLALPDSTRAWGVTKKNGDKFYLTINRLQKLLPNVTINL